jgi:sugar O-acyltransferase (sialic acid O-acetyltransferase NeuD family)
MKKLAIVGAGGHGRVAADIAEQLGWRIDFFDAAYPQVKSCGPWTVVGNDSDLIKNTDLYEAVFVAIGSNHVRKKIQTELKLLEFKLATLISPNATVSQYVQIGEGTLVVANSCINIGSKIGNGAIINTGCIIDHDNCIGDFAHISPGANLAGGVVVGQCSWVGIGSSVIQNTDIAANVIVGAGTVVVKDLPENVTVVGCPAKVIGKGSLT